MNCLNKLLVGVKNQNEPNVKIIDLYTRDIESDTGETEPDSKGLGILECLIF